MKKKSILLRKLSLFAASFLMLFALSNAGYSGLEHKIAPESAKDILKINQDDKVIGDPKAKITIFEYSSLSCPHCADFNKSILPKLKDEYINKGLVNLVHRDFPLNEPALRGSQLAHCAGSERYYIFTKVLFETQSKWAFDSNFKENLRKIGQLGGISGEEFDKCMNDKKLEEGILLRRKSASDLLGIKSTPTFVIAGKIYSGGHSFNDFKSIIDAELKK